MPHITTEADFQFRTSKVYCYTNMDENLMFRQETLAVMVQKTPRFSVNLQRDFLN
jgi:hypothetical protein